MELDKEKIQYLIDSMKWMLGNTKLKNYDLTETHTNFYLNSMNILDELLSFADVIPSLDTTDVELNHNIKSLYDKNTNAIDELSYRHGFADAVSYLKTAIKNLKMVHNGDEKKHYVVYNIDIFL